MNALKKHALSLAVPFPHESFKKQEIEKLQTTQSIHEWESTLHAIHLSRHKKSDLLEMCRKKCEFKKTFTNKSKEFLIQYMMKDSSNDNGLSSWKKADLLGLARTHPEFKSSLERKKKEDIIQFITHHHIEIAPIHKVDSTPDDKEKERFSKVCLRKSKMILLKECQGYPDFIEDVHGKKKQSMVDFLYGKQDIPSESDQVGMSPVHFEDFLEIPDSHTLKEAIVRCLMSTKPFSCQDVERKVSNLM